jgi:hypothetical protein
MSAPTTDLLGVFGLRPDQLETKRAEEAAVTAQRKMPAAHARRDRGRSYVCTDEVLAAAHAMHMGGMSARQVAREMFGQCFSVSPNALAMTFLSAWRGRGWEIRPQGEATALSNVQRGFRPPCSHVYRSGERKGERCSRRCVGNDQWCWHHSPERVAEGIARLRAGAAA